MTDRSMTEKSVQEYREWLYEEERSRHTIDKYMRDIRAFRRWLSGRPLCRQELIRWREELKRSYAVKSINSMLSAVNGYLRFCGRADCCVRQMRVQLQIFCPEEKELSKEEYRRLVETARRRQNERLETALQTLCSTGIRISELVFITAEAVHRGEAEVSCKGKYRKVFLTEELRKLLLEYMERHGITAGPVFRTRSGKPWDRSNIWREMKALCREAEVTTQKVYPHNLRHLFARTFYQIRKDISSLADMLGHSSIDTTRIYIVSAGREHQRQIGLMGLVF